jgi:hypothetical protein
MYYCGFILDEDKQKDLKEFLWFYHWYLSRKDVTKTPPVAALFDKVIAAKLNDPFNLTFEEFSLVYTSAQYLLNLIKTPTGKLYLDDVEKQNPGADWIDEYRELLIEISMEYVNQLNSKMAGIPDYETLRHKVETEVLKV